MAFHHQSEVASLLGSWRTQSDGAGYIGGAVEILCAAVDQQEPVGRQHGIGSLGGLVVNNGSVGTVAGDGAEALVEEQRLLRALAAQDFGHVHLGDFLAGRHAALKLHERVHQGHAVALHGLAHACYLHVVLAGLGHGDGRGALHGAVAEGLEDAVGCGGGVEEHAAARGEVEDECLDRSVGLRGHALLREVGEHVGRQLVGVDEEHVAFRAEVDERCGHGVVAHVAAADVEQPRHLVEGRDEQRVGAVHACAFEGVGHLVGGGAAGVFLIVDEHGTLGQRGAVGPDAVDGVEGGGEAYVAGLEGGTQRAQGAGAEEHGVDAHGGVGGEVGRQPALDGRRVGQSFLHELYLGAGELFGGLQEVARVGPEQGVALGGHHKRAGRAVESAEPAAHLPVRCEIFAHVGVGLGYDGGVDSCAFHFGAERSEACGCFVHVSMF